MGKDNLGGSIILLGAGAALTLGALVYFKIINFTIGGSIGSAYTGSNMGQYQSRYLNAEGTDYANYVPNFDQDMRVSTRGEWDENDYNNTLRWGNDTGKPEAEADGWNPADPPISIRDQTLSNW